MLDWLFNRLERFWLRLSNKMLNVIERTRGPQVVADHLKPTEVTAAILGFLKDAGLDARLRLQFRPDIETADQYNICYHNSDMVVRPPICIGIYAAGVYKMTLITEYGEPSLHLEWGNDRDTIITTYELADPGFFDRLLTDVKANL